MQRALLRVAISPKQQIAAGCNRGGLHRVSSRYPPPVGVVPYIHPAYVNSFAAIVVNLEPVGIFAGFVRVLDRAVIAGHELVDYQRNYAILEPILSQDGEIRHIDARHAVQIGPANGGRTGRIEPLLGKIPQVQPVDLAVHILVHIAHRADGINGTCKRQD